MAGLPQDYDSVMSRKNQVMNAALSIDYSRFESGSMAFDYEKNDERDRLLPGGDGENTAGGKRGKHSCS